MSDADVEIVEESMLKLDKIMQELKVAAENWRPKGMTDKDIKELFKGMIRIWNEDEPGQVQRVFQELNIMDSYDLLGVFAGITAIAAVISGELPVKENLRIKDLVKFFEA